MNPNDRDWQGLVAAMRDRRDDDTPRLVGADFLDDNNEPQLAAFIRVMCKVAMTWQLPNALGAIGWEWLTFSRDSDLLLDATRLLRRTWLNFPCCKVGDNPGQLALHHLHQWRWVRGFPDQVVCDWEYWEEHHELLTALGPIGEVYLTNLPYCGVDELVMSQQYRVWIGEEVIREMSRLDGREISSVYLVPKTEMRGNFGRARALCNVIEAVLSEVWVVSGKVQSMTIDYTLDRVRAPHVPLSVPYPERLDAPRCP